MNNKEMKLIKLKTELFKMHLDFHFLFNDESIMIKKINSEEEPVSFPSFLPESEFKHALNFFNNFDGDIEKINDNRVNNLLDKLNGLLHHKYSINLINKEEDFYFEKLFKHKKSPVKTSPISAIRFILINRDIKLSQEKDKEVLEINDNDLFGNLKLKKTKAKNF